MPEEVGSYAEKARYIVDHNIYMVVATSTKDGKPWAAPVAYAHDSDYNFYFISAVDSRHAEYIQENPNAALAIYSSEEPIGEADGVQIEATIYEVKKADLKMVIETYCKKLFPGSDTSPTQRYKPEQYVDPSEFRFYKAEAKKTYVTGEDRRVEVDLSEG